MKDLNLEDKPHLANPVDEATDEINQFINKLEKVSIVDKWFLNMFSYKYYIVYIYIIKINIIFLLFYLIIH